MIPAICVHSCYAKKGCSVIQGILTVLKEEGKPEPVGVVGRRDLTQSLREGCEFSHHCIVGHPCFGAYKT